MIRGLLILEAALLRRLLGFANLLLGLRSQGRSSDLSSTIFPKQPPCEPPDCSGDEHEDCIG